MAGSFGYAREHYNISMRIGELSLFGPIRKSADAIVLAPGISCRQQIHDGVGRTALHPIELVSDLCR
jgi:Fe-S oxidoreductase